jgi:prepilin-type N-terminal cleavage/methylation domain-containing protein
MKTNSSASRFATGFSLFELLTVVSILGIMITMAIPTFGNSNAATQAKDQRNAQGFCTLAAAASAAGVNVAQGTQDPVVAMTALKDGVTITKGTLKDRLFIMPHVSAKDIQGASLYVQIVNGELSYRNFSTTP